MSVSGRRQASAQVVALVRLITDRKARPRRIWVASPSNGIFFAGICAYWFALGDAISAA